VSGKYFSDCKPVTTSKESYDPEVRWILSVCSVMVSSTTPAHNAPCPRQAVGLQVARRLWDLSAEMVNLNT
jgi:hypothetical protein